MNGGKGITILASILVLTMTSLAANPLDAIASQVSGQINIAQQNLTQKVNNTTEQIQQKAKEEINKQINKSVQLPGFELVFAFVSLLLIAYLSRRYI